MKKVLNLTKILSVLCLVALSFLLVSCGDDDPYDQLNDIVFEDKFFEYDGQAKSIFCEGVPETYTVDYLGNGARNAGSHVVNANILDESGNLAVRKQAHIYILSFEDMEQEYYEGETYSLSCDFVPDGYDVSYIGNEISELGEHEVTAIIYKLPAAETNDEGEEFIDETKKVEVFRLTATLKIVVPSSSDEPIDISGITFDGDVFNYDGSEYYLECQNVPENVYVEYENNFQTEIGTYIVIAILTDEYGVELGRLEATLVIKDPNSDEPTPNPTSDYYVEIGGIVYSLSLDTVGSTETYSQYTGAAEVEADDALLVFGPEGQITNIGDERDGVANTNNAYGSGANMSILVSGTVDIYLKVYNDGGYSIWITGNTEEVAPSTGGGNQGGNGGTTPDLSQYVYALVINGNTYVGLTSKGEAWVDGVKHDEYVAYNVQLNAGDVITLYDVKNAQGWPITNVNPYSSGNPIGSATGITIGEAGNYDIYVQFLYNNDKIYFGPAA